jgi:hypothetical protein
LAPAARPQPDRRLFAIALISWLARYCAGGRQRQVAVTIVKVALIAAIVFADCS